MKQSELSYLHTVSGIDDQYLSPDDMMDYTTEFNIMDRGEETAEQAAARREEAGKLAGGLTGAIADITPFVGTTKAATELPEDAGMIQDLIAAGYTEGDLKKMGMGGGMALLTGLGFLPGAKLAADVGKRAIKEGVQEAADELGTQTRRAFGQETVRGASTKMPIEPDTVKAVGLTDEDIKAWRRPKEEGGNATSEEFRKSLKGRDETLQVMAKKVEAGEADISEYRQMADERRPIRKVDKVPEPATPVEIVSALNAGQRAKGIVGVNKAIPEGDLITARLDINAYTNYDVWVPTLTHPELKTVYAPTVVMRDVNFIKPGDKAVTSARRVATGGEKAPFAVMQGKYVDMNADDAFKYAQETFDSDEWTQVGYDPVKRGFFYDRETGEAVVEADEVIQVGHLVLARNATKMEPEKFPFNRGGLMSRKSL